MKPFGLFYNGKLIETFRYKKSVTGVFNRLVAFEEEKTNHADICVVQLGKGIILSY